MADIALRMEHVWKKFRRGERHDSLRDLFPALAKRLVSGARAANNLQEEEFWALSDISFEIERGEAIGVIGHNGAGKSTMLKQLSGIMRPTSGTLMVNGRLSAMIEVGAGFHQDLTGRENVYLNGVILGMSREEVRRKFDDIVEFSGLAEFIDTPVKRYSSGMFARLGFSVAAHLEPEILIIDEVLSVGDYLFQTKGVEKMKSVVRSGATVIFVSHNLRSVSELCPRTLLLKRGCLVQDGPTSDVITTYMRDMNSSQRDLTNKDVFVEEVVLRGASGPKYDFDAGERACLDVRVKALRDVRRVAVGIHLLDDKFYIFFNTNSARLGLEERDMRAGETFTVTFDLAMHLAAGTFHFGVILYRYDIEHMYDSLRPAATVLVRTTMDVRGAANLYPSARFTG
jgi:lipopolysaccharide transport system ATP-binding protein